MAKNKTNLLPIFSIQSNMVMASINPINTRQCKVLLATGKTITYDCNKPEEATNIHDSLHFFPPNSRNNNSLAMGFEFEQWLD